MYFFLGFASQSCKVSEEPDQFLPAKDGEKSYFKRAQNRQADWLRLETADLGLEVSDLAFRDYSNLP
jgi:hypothetical protein